MLAYDLRCPSEPALAMVRSHSRSLVQNLRLGESMQKTWVPAGQRKLYGVRTRTPSDAMPALPNVRCSVWDDGDMPNRCPLGSRRPRRASSDFPYHV